MPLSLAGALSLIGGLAGLAVVIGVVLAYIKASFAKTNQELAAERITHLTALLEEERRGREADKAVVLQLAGRIDALERENNLLREVVSKQRDFSVLTAQIDHHHREVTVRDDERYRFLVAAIAEIKNSVDELAQRGMAQ